MTTSFVGGLHPEWPGFDLVDLRQVLLVGAVVVIVSVAAVRWSARSGLPTLLLYLGIGVFLGESALHIDWENTGLTMVLGYAALEGLFVGAVSQFFETMYGGIVAQAVLATLATFAGMFLAYKFGLIKVTDKFRRIMAMALIGYAIFAVVNFVYALVTSTPFGIGGSGMLGIGISIFAVGLASLTLALDFDAIDRAIATGAPQKYSWLLAHGLIVTLVWLYIEFLRLLGRLRN